MADHDLAAVLHDDRHCLNGWDATTRWPSCNYTGGHYCVKGNGHKGRCRCVCGSITSTTPPLWEDEQDG